MGKELNNSKGVSNLAMAFSILGLMTLFHYYLTTDILRSVNAAASYKTKQNLEIAHDNILVSLSNDELIKASIQLNENWLTKCTIDSTCEVTDELYPLKLINLKGDIISEGEKHGLNQWGKRCSLVDDIEDHCFFIVKVGWRPLCPVDGSPCMNPDVEIKLDLKLSQMAYGKYNFNLKKYKFSRTIANFSSLFF